MPSTDKIQSLFDSIATDYDHLNHLLSLGIDKTWRSRALRHIVGPTQPSEKPTQPSEKPTQLSEKPTQPSEKPAQPSEKPTQPSEKPTQILDLACGTGDFSIAIARKADPGTHITGVDLSEGMLRVMAQKVAAKGLEGMISAEQGNSEQMRFDDCSFDVATIAFGIRNFEHREAALREILRVLKPSGRLVILELSVPSNPVLRWGYNLYFTKLLPLIGGWISGDRAAYRYLPASVLKFPGKTEWMATMERCGYTNVSHKAFTLGICRMYIGEKPTD